MSFTFLSFTFMSFTLPLGTLVVRPFYLSCHLLTRHLLYRNLLSVSLGTLLNIVWVYTWKTRVVEPFYLSVWLGTLFNIVWVYTWQIRIVEPFYLSCTLFILISHLGSKGLWGDLYMMFLSFSGLDKPLRYKTLLGLSISDWQSGLYNQYQLRY